MKFSTVLLSGAYVIDPEVRTDLRGAFFRFFCREEFEQIGHTAEWLQMNHSFTIKAGTIRGMHYQLPPHGEIKLVRCIVGKVFDVIVDIRQGSSTFLQWFGVELSGENRKMMYIPEGFAHGFQTLASDCELIYHHSARYEAGSEGGMRYDDPAIGIDWPLPVTMVSERDGQHPFLSPHFEGI